MSNFDRRSEDETIKNLLLVGGMMANICANTSQESWRLTARDRENMRNCYTRWDELVKRIRELEKT